MNPTRVVAGNWKMHNGPTETRRFFQTFKVPGALPASGGPVVLVYPPTVSLLAAAESKDRDARIALGVQNIHFEAKGAFTGETSAPLAKDAGATYALIGHSERRHVFGERDPDVAKKITAALQQGLLPMVCVGETLAERKAGRVEEVILGQLDAALASVSDPAVRFMLAYEPVWAIGTGETATPTDAADAHRALRACMDEKIGRNRSAAVSILYGGSVKPDNASELMAAPGVDGLLVGGASVDPASFLRIVEAAL
jgi:triosephosphate isomerase